MITNFEELFEAVGVKDKEGLARAIYKGTCCGASCRPLHSRDGVVVGSIVEGVDGDGTEYYDLHFPFEVQKFWDTVHAVEVEAKEIWDSTHGCNDCPEDPETGYHFIDPSCETCKGEGVIL